jgi:cytochrome c oxidase cbb3-type subunit 2
VRRAWQSSFKRLPPDLARGPYFYLPPTGTDEQRMVRLEQIAKFGIPGTDMPGHEYLSETDIASIGLRLSQVIAQSDQQP